MNDDFLAVLSLHFHFEITYKTGSVQLLPQNLPVFRVTVQFFQIQGKEFLLGIAKQFNAGLVDICKPSSGIRDKNCIL